MEQLSGTDVLFLAMETPAWHQHVGSLLVLDPSEVSRWSPKRVLDYYADRIPFAPKLLWKLKEVPLGLARPVWVADHEFDMLRHFRYATVPTPGGPREVGDVVGHIMSFQLDRRKPLWEIWYLDGLAHDRVGLVFKYHHSVADGMAALGMSRKLMDDEPEPTDVGEPPPPERPDEPSTGELAVRGIGNLAATPLRVGRYGVALAERLGRIAADALTGREGITLGIPRTNLNRRIGPERAFAFGSVGLDDLRRVRSHFGVTVNDAVLAVCAGALRRYLTEQDDLPAKPLVAGCPVSTRPRDDEPAGNALATMPVPLATDIDDPVERLLAIHEHAKHAKALSDEMRAHRMPSMGNVLPPVALGAGFRVLHATGVMTRIPLIMNLTVSNVAGPPNPQFIAGARLVGSYPASIVVETVALNMTVFSHDERLDLGVIGDPGWVEDPWRLVELVREALDELLVAAGLEPATPLDDPFLDDVDVD